MLDPLVEIRGVNAVNNSPSPHGQRPPPDEVRISSSSQRVWAPKNVGTARFYGPGTTLTFDRGQVESPLVYLCKGKLDEVGDGSLIETGLPVARSGAQPLDRLPYWPSYRGADPKQRAHYLDWLLAGRADPNVDIGYVFIYFYGLERRILVDHADHAAVVHEVMRLLKIYGKSRSFALYASGFLWTAIWMGSKRGPLDGTVLFDAMRRTTSWTEETLGMSLAAFTQTQTHLTADVAYVIASHDVRFPRSIVAQRNAELHRDAFAKRFASRFPDGFRLTQGPREHRLEYFPASATLGRLHDNGGPLADEKVPSMLGYARQFQPLVEIWSAATDDLKAYDRMHRKNGGVMLTAEEYEALPENLRQGDHPHFDSWYAVMSRYTTDDGWTVVPISELARLEAIPECIKIAKSQSIRLATTAQHMGLALEPDPRITGRGFGWNDCVSVFPATDELSDDVASYHAAAVLLELGMGIAAADGQVDEVELGRLTSHLNSQFDLSSHDSTRLAHLRYLLSKTPSQELAAARILRKTLSIEQRRLVGEFLVGIAAADEQITAQEVKALVKVYRALGLEPIDLHRLLPSVAVTSANTAAGVPIATNFQLDMTLIEAKFAETAKVKLILREALGEDTDIGDDAEPTPRAPNLLAGCHEEAETTTTPLAQPPPIQFSDPRFQGLPNRFVAFALAVLNRDVWARADFDCVARQHGLMVGAAIEGINEWAFDKLPDALLVDNGSDVLVQRQLLDQGTTG